LKEVKFEKLEFPDAETAEKCFNSHFKMRVRLFNKGKEIWTNFGPKGVIYKIEGRIKVVLFLYLPRLEMILLKITNKGPRVDFDEVEATFLYKGKVAFKTRTETLFPSLGYNSSTFVMFGFNWVNFLKEKGELHE